MRNMFWIIDFIMPALMLILGYYYYFRKSRKPISKYSGLRTGSTLENRKSWELAHKCGGKLLILFGALLVVYTFVIKLLAPLPAEWLSLVNNGISLLVFIVVGAVASHKAREA